ncbi:MAG TPA: triphosphoribosyl-dephospho-CoA synthase [Anaeromyxobacteraceae bacterium]|nr:triphosphoribosyl-dephospho-CoA synthase [Anaeromyxobacteraceae bacterium]
MLAARKARQAKLDRHAKAGHGALVAVSLDMPGVEQAPPGSAELFVWALARMEVALPGDRPVRLHVGDDALGPFALLAMRAAPLQAEAACLAVEASHPAARLVALDVYGPGGVAVDRAALGLPPRLCLLCDAPARECIRLGRHPAEALAARVAALLSALTPASGGRPLRPRETLATHLLAGARRALHLTPKPGLVDLEDCGSRPELTLELMERSLGVVGETWQALAGSLARGEPLAAQVALGQAGEQRMLALGPAATHKGALFLGGLLLAARHRLPSDRADLSALRPAVAAVAGEVLEGRQLPESHGAEARRAYQTGGIVREAREGLPAIFDVALPAWEEASAVGLRGDAAVFFMLARLMQVVEDTTVLHLGGTAGLYVQRADGLALEILLLAREDHAFFLRATKRAWRAAQLTMGGVGDLLGVALALLVHAGEPPP